MIWAYMDAVGRRLLGWSVLSVAVGLVGVATGEAFWRAFGIQCVVWGLIDAGIALLGRRNARRRARPAAIEAQALRRALWVNAGLDVGYILIGAGVAWAGAGHPEWLGHAAGVVVQGVFLLGFDAWHAVRLPPPLTWPSLAGLRAPEHQAFHWPGVNGHSAVLVHGFPGTPAEIRALAQALHNAGWTVSGLLLPGFGADLPTLADRTYADWEQAVATAVQAARQQHQRVVVVGYSFGAGVALGALTRQPADAAVFIAPFYWPEPWWVRLVLLPFIPLLPYAFRPYARADFNQPALRHGLSKLLPQANWDDPVVQAQVRGLAVPLTLFEQLRELRHAPHHARRLTFPALFVQGAQDPIARSAWTRALAARWGGPVQLVELPAGHNLIEPGQPGHPALLATLVHFLNPIAQGDNA